MEFEWDEAKDWANTEKHGVSFDLAKGIFERRVLTSPSSRHEFGEQRFVSIGQIEDALIVVVHTRRNGRIRLISARPASRKERLRYHEKIRETSDNR